VAISIAVSSWALHRTIGASYHDSPATGPRAVDIHGEKPLDLFKLPAELAAHGYKAMQLCHFHLPSREESYLADLKQALRDAGISLHAVLIDEGDPSDPIHAERDMAWMGRWVDTAETLGAAHVRVIAGKQETSAEGIVQASANVKALAAGRSLRVETENWFPLLSSPAAVHEFLDRCEGTVGLCADWGNWPRPRKYDELPLILPRAETCHAKLEFVSADQLDEEDASRCISMTRAAGFGGSYILVNGGAGDSEWDALAIQKEAILA